MTAPFSAALRAACVARGALTATRMRRAKAATARGAAAAGGATDNVAFGRREEASMTHVPIVSIMRRRALCTLALTCLAALTGCTASGDACSSNIECGTGICLDGVCADACSPEAPTCAEGFTCVDYTVRDLDGGVASTGWACSPGPAGPAIGEPCTDTCAAGGVCVKSALLPEGTCRRACSGASCPVPEICMPQISGPSYCN